MPFTLWKSLWETRFPSFREEMNKVFEDILGTEGFPSLKEMELIPAVNIHETKSDVVILMDVPAINPKDISISVCNDKLTVGGERKREKELREGESYRSGSIFPNLGRQCKKNKGNHKVTRVSMKVACKQQVFEKPVFLYFL